MTRVLYDAIWNEYCDWGLELAKVRLADESLEPAAREATWWTLVEVLDTYLRLLHPVMPFVTEALWAAIPHRATDPELLIVARWPAALERDLDAEAEVGTVVDAHHGDPQRAGDGERARPAAVLEARVHVPSALGATFEALRPAVERLARVRPLHRELTPEALHAASSPDDLAVVVPGGEVEASIRPAAADAGRRGARPRAARARAGGGRGLARWRPGRASPNDAFMSKAPPPVVEGARAREAELADQVVRLRERLGR